MMDSPDLKASQHYINRELSFLEFNQRVLAQAFDESVPLLERLRFLCISSSNLDEFFEIRVAGLKQLLELGTGQFATDTLSLQEQLAAVHARAMRLCSEQYRCLNDVLMPALQKQGISLQGRAAWSPAAENWLERYFENEIEPVLSPLGLDPARPFPADSEQESELHRAPARQRCLRPRQRARHRAGAPLLAACRAGTATKAPNGR